jgi:hypothetical protein
MALTNLFGDWFNSLFLQMARQIPPVPNNPSPVPDVRFMSGGNELLYNGQVPTGLLDAPVAAPNQAAIGSLLNQAAQIGAKANNAGSALSNGSLMSTGRPAVANDEDIRKLIEEQLRGG